MAHGLSLSSPDISTYENSPLIESVQIKGVRSLSIEKLEAVLSQKTGEEISLTGVQSDLKAIAALYKKAIAVDVEPWSGLELITSRVTVVPDIEYSTSGHVILTYNVKEWFPSKN
jgi:outer membrane protein assembly factor BamA